ncbi:MAG: hypothetical protein E7543_04055 [Ruminococcaceae bacterium]|nr:hypothetical protein [Oscillospiraceae bacterium]
MAKSLLAHLYTHIRGSQEDIATMSLQYLLMQSAELNKTFTKKVSKILHIDTDETLQYDTQVTGEDKERPDMVGVDSEGKEMLICEMKFYAGLTDNQPLGYLDRLKKNGGKGLLFICPESRIETLWYELEKICKGKNLIKTDKRCVCVDGISLSVITWMEIIRTLMDTAQASEKRLIADIEQLKGYCELIDEEAFIPFKPEELTAINAKKEDRFYTVIDKVTDLLLCDDTINANKKGLRLTPNSDGTISYIYVNGYGLGICYDRYFWRSNNSVETPFWLLIKNNRWEQTKEILKVFKKYDHKVKEEYNSVVYLALNALPYATEDVVCKDIKKQILTYLDDIDRETKEKQ